MKYRDVDWYVKFEININGEEASWEDLADEERRKILDDIEGDYYYGNFVCEDDESYNLA